MALKDWKRQIVRPNRILWTKGNFISGYGYPDWVHVDDLRKDTYKNGNYEVGARNTINPQTVNGHFKYFKTKSQAVRFAKSYMRTH